MTIPFYRRYLPYLVDGFNHLEKSLLMGRIIPTQYYGNNVPNHQPDIQGLWLDIATSPMAKHMAQYLYFRSLTWPLFLWVKTIF